MSKGYSSEDAEDRLQRAREAKKRDAEEADLAERILAKAQVPPPRAAKHPPRSGVDQEGAE